MQHTSRRRVLFLSISAVNPITYQHLSDVLYVVDNADNAKRHQQGKTCGSYETRLVCQP